MTFPDSPIGQPYGRDPHVMSVGDLSVSLTGPWTVSEAVQISENVVRLCQGGGDEVSEGDWPSAGDNNAWLEFEGFVYSHLRRLAPAGSESEEAWVVLTHNGTDPNAFKVSQDRRLKEIAEVGNREAASELNDAMLVVVADLEQLPERISLETFVADIDWLESLDDLQRLIGNTGEWPSPDWFARLTDSLGTDRCSPIPSVEADTPTRVPTWVNPIDRPEVSDHVVERGPNVVDEVTEDDTALKGVWPHVLLQPEGTLARYVVVLANDSIMRVTIETEGFPIPEQLRVLGGIAELRVYPNEPMGRGN